MKLVALMPVRNEAWCLGLTLRVALLWCDEVVVFAHNCTDRSAEIALRCATATNRVTVVGKDDPLWDEMTHRQAMLELARVKGRPGAPDGPGATHIALVDADELMTADIVGRARGWIQRFNKDELVRRRLEMPLYNLRDGWKYHANGIWGDRVTTIAFEDQPSLHWAGDRFHHREPMGMNLVAHTPVQHGTGGVLHLWGFNERRLRAKHALYKVTERLRWPDKPVEEIERYYNQAIYNTTAEKWTYREVPEEWLDGYQTLISQYLELEAEPWQVEEVNRLVHVHGFSTFRGLDLFGIA